MPILNTSIFLFHEHPIWMKNLATIIANSSERFINDDAMHPSFILIGRLILSLPTFYKCKDIKNGIITVIEGENLEKFNIFVTQTIK